MSFLESVGDYVGGMHPDYYYFGRTYDAETGNTLSLDDIVADKTALIDSIIVALRVKYPNFDFFDLENNVESSVENNSLQWTLGYRELTVYFKAEDSVKLFRVTVKSSAGMQTIDGADINSCFDGIMFAG